MGSAAASELLGMPEPYSLERHVAGEETFVTRGPYVVSRFDSDDIGMRNLAVVALTDAGHSGLEVAACFGITPVYVSMLRGDLAGRAVCFSSGEPSGLSVTIHGVVAELRAVCGPAARLLLGFDRGGSYPGTFAKLRDAGADWVTYRRGALVEPTAAARWSWFALDGRRHSYRIAEETVDLEGYGSARQISVYEGGKVVFQVLTSDTTATAARLVHLLRCRWRIENAFKYLTEHNGIDALCDCTMTVCPDTAKVANPARTAATATLRSAEAARRRRRGAGPSVGRAQHGGGLPGHHPPPARRGGHGQ